MPKLFVSACVIVLLVLSPLIAQAIPDGLTLTFEPFVEGGVPEPPVIALD